MPFQCSVCTDPTKRAWIAERLRLGDSPNVIERLSRQPMAADMGIRPIKYETILRHVRHMDRPRVEVIDAGPALVLEANPTSPVERRPTPTPSKAKVVTEFTPGQPIDVATIVQRKAVEGIERGDLMVTTAHGLQAQKMIDTREDKRKDRELAVNIARLLSGSVGIPGHLVVRDVTPPTLPDDYVPSLPGAPGDPS
jgi:hypothetical protein